MLYPLSYPRMSYFFILRQTYKKLKCVFPECLPYNLESGAGLEPAYSGFAIPRITNSATPTCLEPAAGLEPTTP